MIELRIDEAFELGNELMHALGRQVEVEQLDGDEALARRVVRAKHGAQRPGANLMKNTKRSERVRERTARRFRVQRRISSGRPAHGNTDLREPAAIDRRLNAVRSSA